MKSDILNAGDEDVENAGPDPWQDMAAKAQAALVAGNRTEASRTYEDLITAAEGWLVKLASFKVQEDNVDAIVAETEMALWSALNRPDPIGNIRAFLRTTLKNRIADYYRRAAENKTEGQYWNLQASEFWDKQADTLEDPELDPARAFEEREAYEGSTQLVNSMLATLTDEQRAVWIARKDDNLPLAKIGERLNLTEDQVKKRLQAAKRRLQQAALERGLI